MTEPQRSPLELLSSLESYGYQEKIVEIENVKITLAPLSVGEVISIFERVGLLFSDSIAGDIRVKVEVIAHAIIKVGDVQINTDTRVNDNINVIKGWGEELIEYLFENYCELDSSIRKIFDDKKIKQDEDLVEE
jgi:hypothetical protein